MPSKESKKVNKQGKLKRKRAKSSPQRNENIIDSDVYKYKSIFEDVEISVTYISLEGNILAINTVGAQGFGGVPDDFVGKSIYGLLPKVANLSKDRIQKLIDTGSGDRYEDKIELASGERWYSSSFHPVRNSKGELYAILVLSQDITTQHKAAEQLKLLSSMVKQSTEGMALTDLNGNIQFINNAFAEMHGYTPDELIGKNLTIFHNKNQIASVREAAKTVQRTGVFIGEIWHKHRDGSIFPTIMHNSILRDESGNSIGMIGTLRDITLQKQAEDALRNSEESYRLLINSADSPIILFDLDGRVILVNDTSANYFGVQTKAIIGKSMQELFPDIADELIKRNRKVIETGVGFEVEDHIQLPTAKRWFASNLQPARDANGNIYGVLIISHDITERKIAEEMLKKTTEELEAERNALQEKNVTLKQVLSHIEDDRRDSLFKIQKEIGKAVLPLLKRLKKKMGSKQSREIETLEMALKAVLAKDMDSFQANFGTLTARESEICELIKSGLSSKEISVKLNLSLLTVFKHREQIRKKLEITNKNIGLATYLRSHK